MRYVILRMTTDSQLLPDWKVALSDRRLRAVVRGGVGILGTGLESSGTMLLDDIHNSSQHTGDVTNIGPSWSGHRSIDWRGDYEEIRRWRGLQERRAQLLGQHSASGLGAFWRAELICRGQGECRMEEQYKDPIWMIFVPINYQFRPINRQRDRCSANVDWPTIVHTATASKLSYQRLVPVNTTFIQFVQLCIKNNQVWLKLSENTLEQENKEDPVKCGSTFGLTMISNERNILQSFLLNTEAAWRWCYNRCKIRFNTWHYRKLEMIVYKFL